MLADLLFDYTYKYAGNICHASYCTHPTRSSCFC